MVKGFLNFVREQGVVGLAVGFLLGGAVSKIVTALVTDIINPILAPILGAAGNFREATLSLGPVHLLWGDFLANLIDFSVIAAIVYFVVHGLGLDKIDKPKEKEKGQMNRIILIGGSPTVGKSYFTRNIAEDLKLPWISTDTIREAMRRLVRKEDYPNLFHFDNKDFTAESYLSSHSPQQIVDSVIAESKDVWKGVKAFLDTDYVWKNYLMEGVAIIPELVSQIDNSKYEIKPLFLVDENEDRIREVVYTRGLWDDADKYSNSVKEVEVEWAILFNQYIKSEAIKYGYNYHVVVDRDKSLMQLTAEIKGLFQESKK